MPTAFQDPSVDSEFSFYATFWIAYGVYTINTARTPKTNTPAIAASLFLLAGMARIPSILFLGTPHTLFLLLMGIELTLPMLLLLLWWIVKQRNPAWPSKLGSPSLPPP